jgi:predicted TPR repeat methyltransferase
VFQSASSNLFQTGALDKLLVDDAQKRATDASSKAQAANANAAATYGKLVKLTPKDAELWYLMAISAEAANQLPVAIKGYKQFLKLSPDAAETQIVKDRIKSLEQAAKQSAVTPGGTTAVTR